MEADPVVEILVEVLNQCACDRALFRRIQDGKIHEDMVLSGLAGVAREAGLPANLIDVSVSNYPLEMRLDAARKPSDYEYSSTTFMEVGGHVMRLAVVYISTSSGGGKNILKAVVFPSMGHALAAQADKMVSLMHYHEWRDTDENGADPAGLDALAAVAPLSDLMAKLQAAIIEKSTAPAQSTSKSMRL